MSKEVTWQDPLPGLDELSMTMERYANNVDAAEAAHAKEEAELTCIRTAQDVVWRQFCDDTIPARQETWRVVVASLRDAPQVSGYQDSSEFANKWRFVTQRAAENGSKVQLVTNVSTRTRRQDLPRELEDARIYLGNPVSGQACPDELLGVRAEGKPRKRMLPVDGLRKVFLQTQQTATLDNIHNLTASVVASVLGSSAKSEQLVAVNIFSEWHDPSVRSSFLDSENADSVKTDFYRGAFGDYGQEMSPDALMQFLGDRAAERNDAYEKLTAIASILSESAPFDL